jgi:hypothetical protein
MFATMAIIDIDVSASALLGWHRAMQPPEIHWTPPPDNPAYSILGELRIAPAAALPRLLTADEEALVMASLRASSQLDYAF